MSKRAAFVVIIACLSFATARGTELRILATQESGGGFVGFCGISGNGSTAFFTTMPGYEGFRWTASKGAVSLGAGATPFNINHDGSTIVGSLAGSAFRWTAAKGMETLPLTGAPAISADGAVYASWDSNGPFRWTAEKGREPLAYPGPYWGGVIWDVSADGSSAVGWLGNYEHGDDHAAYWNAAGQLAWTGGGYESGAYAISADGAWIVGHLDEEPVRWTADGKPSMLAPPGFTHGGSALGVSADGSTIVGFEDELGAFVWDSAHGMRSLQSVLENDYGMNLSGWSLDRAWGVSDDGRVICGLGSKPDGQPAVFLADMSVPEPSGVLAMGLTVLLGVRHRSRTRHIGRRIALPESVQ